jgi:hypothetical protein
MSSEIHNQTIWRYWRHWRYGNIPLSTTSIRTDNDTLLDVQVLPDPSQGTWLGIEVINRDVEEALDLTGMQIHGDDVIATGRLQHVGNQLGTDWGSGLVLLVLASVGEVGDDGSDTAGTSSLAGIDHDEKLHEAIVDVTGGSGLKDEDYARTSKLAFAELR